MFNGYSTLGAVALRIAEDYNAFSMRESTHYTVKQAIEKVCFRKESITSSNSNPSYIWCWFDTIDGQARLQYDKGKLTEVRLANKPRTYRYIAIRNEPSAEDLLPCWSDDFQSESDLRASDRFMLEQGISFQQRFLIRYSERHWTDYWGESDMSSESEIVYGEPSSEPTFYIPIINPFLPKRYSYPQKSQLSVA